MKVMSARLVAASSFSTMLLVLSPVSWWIAPPIPLASATVNRCCVIAVTLPQWCRQHNHYFQFFFENAASTLRSPGPTDAFPCRSTGGPGKGPAGLIFLPIALRVQSSQRGPLPDDVPSGCPTALAAHSILAPQRWPGLW